MSKRLTANSEDIGLPIPKTMSKETLSFMFERSGLGGWEDGAGSSRVVGIADTGQGISTAMAVMPMTTNRLVKSRLENLSSEVNMIGSTCRWNRGRGWRELGKPKLMNQWKEKQKRTHTKICAATLRP